MLSMIFWGFSFIWFKIANKTFQPVTIVFLRLLFSVILLTIYLILAKGFMKIRKGDFKLFLTLALFEPFFYFLGESFGLTYVSATVCSVMISTIPVFATIGAWLIFKEKLRKINYAGIILSFIGVLVFLLNRDGSLSYNLKGLALLLFAVLSAVGYNLTLSRLVGKYSPAYIVNVQNIIGATLFLPIFMITDFNTFIHHNYAPVTFLADNCTGGICIHSCIYPVCILGVKNRHTQSKCFYQFYTPGNGSFFIHINGRQADTPEYSWYDCGNHRNTDGSAGRQD